MSHICACMHGKMNWQKNLRYKEGYHSMQQPMQVNILWLRIGDLCYTKPVIGEMLH